MLMTTMKQGAPGDRGIERGPGPLREKMSAGKEAAHICQPHRKPAWEAHRFIAKKEN